MQRLCLHAVHVRTVARIDFDDFAFVDEERHAHFHARLELCRLERVGSRVAFEARFGVNDFELRLDGHFSVEKART